MRELSKSFPGKVLWDGIQFDVTRGQRIGVIGPNGSGKTTLLRILVGQTDADTGEVLWGANLNIGYYDQRLDDFDPDATVLEEARGNGHSSKISFCATCWHRCCFAATTCTSRCGF